MTSYVRTEVYRNRRLPGDEGKLLPSICSLCNGGCGLLVRVNDAGYVEAVYGDTGNPYNQGKICPKPMEIVQTLYGAQRVDHPLKKVNGIFQRISWEEALSLVTEKYLEHWQTSGNSAIVGITSKIGGSHSKLALSIFSELTGLVTYGTGPICYDTEENVRKAMFGNGSASAPLADAVEAGILLIVGNNPAQTKAGQFHWVQEARYRGTKVVVIDPRYTETARQADRFLQIRPGTDGALGMALLHEVIAHGWYDASFVTERTNGFEKLAQAVTEFSPVRAEEMTGVPRRFIEELAWDLSTRKPGMLWEGRGVVCVNNAGNTLRVFEALMAILGNVGKPGAGIISHINGYGRAKGLVPGADVVKPERKRSAEALYPALENGEIKMLLIAGNPCANWPDCGRMQQAVSGLDFVVSHTLVLDDSARLADVVLPATHWLEEAGMQASVHRVMQWKEPVARPYAEAKSAGEIFRLLAAKMGLPVKYFPDSPETAWEWERTHNGDIAGITVERMRRTAGGVHYPCPESGEEAVRLFQDGVFSTPSEKVELVGSDVQELNYLDLLAAPGNRGLSRQEYPYLLSTVKVAAHYHTECQYSDWAVALEKPCVEIHPDTAANLSIREGDRVRIETPVGSLELPARLTWTVPRDCLFTQPYFTQTSPYGQVPANILFPAVTDPEGGNFVNKNIMCRISALEVAGT